MRVNRINVINWGQILNVTINFNESDILLSGQNGSGKTTLIDAIGFFIYGGSKSWKCGGSTVRDESRTAINYILGISSKGRSTYREPSSSISYIRFEFTDGYLFKTFLLVLEPTSTKDYNPYYFTYDDTFDKCPILTNDNLPLSHLDINNYLLLFTDKNNCLMKSKLFKEQLDRTFGITQDEKSKQYRKLLPFNVQANEIFKNQSILFSYILDEPEHDTYKDLLVGAASCQENEELLIYQKNVKDKINVVLPKYTLYSNCIKRKEEIENNLNAISYFKITSKIRIEENNVSVLDEILKEKNEFMFEMLKEKAQIAEDIETLNRAIKEPQVNKYTSKITSLNKEASVLETRKKDFDNWKLKIKEAFNTDKQFKEYFDFVNKNDTIENISEVIIRYSSKKQIYRDEVNSKKEEYEERKKTH